MNKQQKEQLRGWGIDPKIIKKKRNYKVIILSIVCVLLLGIVLFLGFMVSQNQNIYNSGFNKGIIYAANYTTITGNFSYIQNDTIGVMNIANYCSGIIG